jgi:AraC-like DNA-binding protein
MTVEDPYPLFIQKLKLPPSNEWSPRHPGWTMVRVAEGAGYCLQAENTRILNVGDGFMSSASTKVSVRASQLGSLLLQFVRIEPGFLNGLLTVAECFGLEAAQRHTPCIYFFKAEELAGQKFARLAAQSPNEPLPVRCAWLQLWANSVNSLLATADPVADGTDKKLRRRFRQLVEQMPETELSRHSVSDLARRLECSERHFSRLFSKEFGVSFRSHQIDLRLQQACQLLADPGNKIAAIAYEVGYRHLGLFNYTFKKRFGMTPGVWRQQTQMKPRQELQE